MSGVLLNDRPRVDPEGPRGLRAQAGPGESGMKIQWLAVTRPTRSAPVMAVGFMYVALWGGTGASLCAAEDAAPETNLLKNPGFEQVERRRGRVAPKEWAVHKWRPDIEVLVDQTMAHRGKNSMKIFAIRPNDRLGAAISQAVTGITPGVSYRVSGWVRSEGLRRWGIPGSVCIQLNFLGADQQRVALFDCYASDSPEWKQIAVTGKAPPGSAAIKVTCLWEGRNTDGIIWFDDLALTEVRTPARVGK